MRISKKSPKKEKRIMTFSLYANLFFVIVELFMAVYTSSQTVLLDAVYDGIEFFMLLPSIFLIPLLYRSSNEKYPFGYMQMETVFIVVKGVTMIAATVGRQISFDTVAGFELFACILGVIVTIYLRRKNKGLNSPIVKAEMQGWKIDSMISIGMTAAFFLPVFVEALWVQRVSPYLDALFTMILSVVMLPVPIKTVSSAIRDLLLISPEEEIVLDIKSIVEPIIFESKCSDLHYNIVRTGRKLWISAYITLDKDELSVRKMQLLQARCIATLAQQYADFYFELLPEIEYDKEEVKQFMDT